LMLIIQEISNNIDSIIVIHFNIIVIHWNIFMLSIHLA